MLLPTGATYDKTQAATYDTYPMNNSANYIVLYKSRNLYTISC